MSENIRPSEVSEVLLRQLKDIDTSLQFDEVGTVLQVSDGVVRIYGLLNAEANELLEFENGIKAIVMNLEEDNVGAVLLGPTDQIKEGMIVKRTKRIASIKVGESMLGRVIDPLGEPLDGRGQIGGELCEMPLERKAPGVIFRQPVNQPLQTGLKSVDAMIPIGRGQRELIIGDRQTGKTAIAIDTILNQKANYEAGKPVYCIYVAVGQKGSTVANIVNVLKERGALDYTIVVAATAADPAALQYFAPFAGAAIGEYFRDTGRHALVVYDDLSKQAVSYREVSLILRRPSGREAYPGDIIGLHNHGTIQIGDTFTQGEDLHFSGIPNFAPELFRRIRLKDPLKQKQLLKGLVQLSEEGAVQVFRPISNNDLIVGAVGVLQFEVLEYRLKNEYNVDIKLEPLPYEHIRWIENPEEVDVNRIVGTSDMKKIKDLKGNPLLVFANSWSVNMVLERNEGLKLSEFGKNN